MILRDKVTQCLSAESVPCCVYVFQSLILFALQSVRIFSVVFAKLLTVILFANFLYALLSVMVIAQGIFFQEFFSIFFNAFLKDNSP